MVAGGNVHGEVAIWDLTSHERLAIWSLDPSRAIEGVAFSPNAEILSAHHGHTAWLVETGSQETVRRFEIENCHGVAFSPDGETLASASSTDDYNPRGVIKLWRTSDGQCIWTRTEAESGKPKEGSTAYCVAFSPDEALLASRADDGTLRLWGGVPRGY